MQSQLPTNHPDLKIYKVYPEAHEPLWGTTYSACFDLKASLPTDSFVTAYNSFNEKLKLVVLSGENVVSGDTVTNSILLPAKCRAMIPTGLILDIPVGYSVRVHSRSGLGLKRALVLANHEGVIDSDYIDPTYIILENKSNTWQRIYDGDRIAQAEMVPDIAYRILSTEEKPKLKSDRNGGFGSTGM